MKVPSKPAVDIDALRYAIQKEYETVASEPQKGFHFHTGHSHTQRVGYNEEWLKGIPEGSIASFAGTGNPFSRGELRPGEQVVDVGCGPGIVVQKAVSENAKESIDLWTVCIAGALLKAKLEATVLAVGFKDFEVTWRAPIYEDAPQKSSAQNFGTLGVNFRAIK